MKKVLGLLLVFALIFASGTTAFAGEKGVGKGHGKADKAAVAVVDQIDYQKAFKAELNAQKKEVAKAKGALEEQQALLLAEYNELVAAGLTAEAEAKLGEITALDTDIAALQAQMKQIINERYMIIKTEYSNEELASFENAAAVIEQMYADASALGAGTIVVRDNIIKLEAPAYIKGGRAIIPVRAITEELGATVAYDPATQTVHIAKDGIEILLTVNSKAVLVNGVPQELDASAEITCGRTYVPLRFIAETFGLAVDFDAETGTIDIEEDAEATDETTDEAIDETAGDATTAPDAEADAEDAAPAADDAADETPDTAGTDEPETVPAE